MYLIILKYFFFSFFNFFFYTLFNKFLIHSIEHLLIYVFHIDLFIRKCRVDYITNVKVRVLSNTR